MAEQEFNYIVRINNTDLDGSKQIADALRKIKGVNFMFANAVCVSAGVARDKQAGLLDEAEIHKLTAVLQDPSGAGFPTWLLNRRKDYETGADMHLYTNDLRFTNENDRKRLQKTKSYRGLRLAAGLPVRGQRTQSNFRKNKGKKR